MSLAGLVLVNPIELGCRRPPSRPARRTTHSGPGLTLFDVLLAGRLLPGGKDEVVQVQWHGAEADGGLASRTPKTLRPWRRYSPSNSYTLGYQPHTQTAISTWRAGADLPDHQLLKILLGVEGSCPLMILSSRAPCLTSTLRLHPGPFKAFMDPEQGLVLRHQRTSSGLTWIPIVTPRSMISWMAWVGKSSLRLLTHITENLLHRLQQF